MYAIKRKCASQWLAHKGKGSRNSSIPASQWMVLAAVMRSDDLTISDLSDLLGVSSSAATQLVDVLVTKKYLVRKESARDRRARSLSLTETAKKKLVEMKNEYLTRLGPVFDALSDVELKQYAALNKKIADHITAH